MSKFRYIFKRILHMNYKGFFEKLNIVHQKSGKNRMFIFFDMIACGLKYQAGYVDYELFEMYNLNRSQRKTILTRGRNNEFMKKLNDSKFSDQIERKDLFNKNFEKFLKRDWLDFNKCTKKQFDNFISKHEVIMVKPIDGMCGHGIEKINVKDYKKNELYDHIKSIGNVILEELIIQNKDMAKMYPDAINTCRIVTILKDRKAYVVAAYLRIGNSTFVDNFNSGGMVVPINKETGVIEYNALDKKHNLYEKHPKTGTKFIGFKIPMWEEAKDLVKAAAKVIPEMRLVGWDVGISDKGPLLVEGNDFPGHDIYQLPPHRTNGIGVLPEFEKVIYGKEKTDN